MPAAWRAAARRIGHGAELHLRTYAHVIDTLDDTRYPDLDALIAAARAGLRVAWELPSDRRARLTTTTGTMNPACLEAVPDKPSIGLEPMTPSLPWKCSTN